MSEHLLLIGACGWEHPQWDADFYPDDLPPEWRLGFYGNEFPVVLIPEQAWQQGVPAVKGWLDETHDSPRFIAEWPVGVTARHEFTLHLSMLQALAERLLAVSVKLDTIPDMQQQAYLRELAQQAPLVLDINATMHVTQLFESMQAALQLELSCMWHGEMATSSCLRAGRLAMARISAGLDQPRELRRIIETLLANAANKSQVVVLFDGQPPSIRQMRAAGVILDLL